MTRLVALPALACALMVTGAPALAHAVLVASTPAAGERLERAPQSVTLTFDDGVETSLGSLRVIDAAGSAHSSGAVMHPGGDARRVAIALANMTNGRYVVAWQVVSADSHLVNGAFAFGVGVAAGDAPAVPAANGATLFLPILHFVLLAAALLGIGLPIGVAAIARTTRRAPMFVEFGAWIVLAFAAFTDVAFRADLAGGTLASAFTTHVGVLRLVTIAAAVLGVLALTGRARRVPLLIVAALVAALSLSIAGHAAGGAFAPLGIAADMLHLLAAAGWIGVLALATTLEGEPALRNITPLAASAVGVLIVTGIVQTVRNAGSFTALVNSPYGMAIDLKVALLILALVLAVFARRALQRGSFAIGLRVKAELWLLTGIVAVTAVLVETPLPRETAAAHALLATAFDVRNVHVRVAATSIDAQHWTIRIDADGPLDAADLSVTNAERHVGPLAIPTQRAASGTFTATAALPFAGTWTLLTSVRNGAFDEAHRTLTLSENAP